MNITRAEQRELLVLAGRAIAEKLSQELITGAVKPELTDTLLQKCGVFVSVYVDKKLRGCIGTFSEEYPLYKNVENMAVAAAMEDSRFNSIQAHEFPELELEISILTPRQRIDDPSEIIIGRHGIFIRSGSRHGTFLPQVAVTQNWTAEEFLGNCSRHKVGLGWDGWKGAELFIYEAKVFRAPVPSI